MTRSFITKTLVFISISSCAALRCWKCNNAKSEKDCIENGQMQRCRRFQRMSCQTEVRFHEGWGGGPLITTGCKEYVACNSNKGQNSQCTPNTMNSVCRCCCDRFNCNKRNLLCDRDDFRQVIAIATNMQADQEKTRPTPVPKEENWKKATTLIDPFVITVDVKPWKRRGRRCASLGKMKHGEISCSGSGNEVGTVCQFRCLDHGFQLDYNYVAECVESDGDVSWTNRKPRCVPKERCPPIAKKDVVILLESSTNAHSWKITKQFVADTIGKFDVSPNAVQFSVIRFNAKVDLTTQILFEDYRRDKEGLQMAVKDFTKTGSGVRFGKALSFTKNRLLTQGNRNSADDIIWVVTSGKTRDPLLSNKVSQELRRSGVKIFAMGISNGAGETLTNQLIAMTGNRDRVILVDSIGPNNADNLISRFAETLCD